MCVYTAQKIKRLQNKAITWFFYEN